MAREYACGAGFFSETFSPFLPACKLHDIAYMDSELLYVNGFLEEDEEKKSKALQDRLAADIEFAEDCRRIANSYMRILRPFMKAWANFYIGAVFTFGLDIWMGSVVRMLEERASDKDGFSAACRIDNWGKLDRLIFVNSNLCGYRSCQKTP